MVGMMRPFTKTEPRDQFGSKDVSSVLGKLSLRMPVGLMKRSAVEDLGREAGGIQSGGSWAGGGLGVV